MKSWYTIRARSSGTEVLIYDEIGAYGVTAKGFLAELAGLPGEASIDLRLNSPGGSVFDAVAIYNALKRHTGDITVWIDGIAASAASYIAMAGDTIVMPENAFLMIHDPSGLVMGTAEDMRSTAEALDKVKGSLIQGYAAKSGKSDDEIALLMAAESWLDAKDALEFGFIDRIAKPVKLAASFDVARFRNAPPELVEVASEPDEPAAQEAQSEGVADANTEPNPESPAAEAPNQVASETPMDDPATGRAEAIAHARAVIDLCRLAGQLQMAGRFLEEDVGLDEVRNRLLAAKAEATPDITAAHAQPGRADCTQSWGDVIARTFKTKG
ncbi:head maturation protease, ClpP-related [Thalassobacter stenotrophicus]|uniref:head maturation protease, ClpP-related n=1 Tax=Thalassobacter stenotrophicus TaxID=266809 RepID=UPI0014032F30|nr:head maturation protease, ClpP-related [Thalassobacter stenotrophicus]